jgi:predicted ATPase
MSRIKIKYFGPIQGGCLENDGWIEISKTTIFIGNQGSGKSTVAKLISTFTWIEKALVRGDYDKKWFERKNRLKNQFLNYHRLENYPTQNNGLGGNTEIEYEGDAYHIKYEEDTLFINEVSNNNYFLPQIMYVPAERNFIAYVKSPKELKLSSDSLKEFLTEFDNSKRNMKGLMELPINNVNIEYDRLNDILNIKGEKYKVKLTDASSGFQSLVPLYLVSDYLSKSVQKQSENREKMSTEEETRFKVGIRDIWSSELTNEQKRLAISVLSSKFNKTSFINIVEEPEQNLFPSSQWQLLKKLLEFNNLNSSNKLIMTTHSPYVINYLSIAIQADYLKRKIKSNSSLMDRLDAIVPIKSTVNSNNISVYQLDEKTGVIKKLNSYDGIPSDKNLLNESLAEGNNLFDSLLEFEQEL